MVLGVKGMCSEFYSQPNLLSIHNTIPVEATESIAPVMFKRREFRESSGGAGKHRGGLGQVIELTGADGAPIALLCNFERVKNPARGRNGGGKGAPGSVELDLVMNPDGTRCVKKWTLPAKIDPDKSSGVFFGSKVDGTLKKADSDQWNLDMFK